MSVLLALAYAVGSVVCHQIPERSFYYAGFQFPVCARCTGLYISGALGVVIWLMRSHKSMTYRHAVVALTMASVPTLVTLVTAGLGWWDPVNVVRAALAAPLGFATGAVVTAGLTRHLR